MRESGNTGLERAKALVRTLRFVRARGDTTSFEELSAMAALLVSGEVSRGRFDGAVLDLLASIGVDRDGVAGWLSDMADGDLSTAFANDDRKIPSPYGIETDIVTLADGSTGMDTTPGFAFLTDVSCFKDASRPALIGGYDLSALSKIKKAYPNATVLCIDHSERAAIELWMHLDGVPFDGSDVVLLDDEGDFDVIVSLLSADVDPLRVAELLAEGGSAVVEVDLETIIDQDTAQGREDLIRSAPVDAIMEYHDFCFLLLKRGRDADAPIYLAKMTGLGALASFPRPDGRWRGTMTKIEAIRSHTTVPFFGRDVTIGEISEHPWHSLSLADYAPVIPPTDSVRPADGVAESLLYSARLEEETSVQGRFLEAFRTAMENI